MLTKFLFYFLKAVNCFSLFNRLGYISYLLDLCITKALNKIRAINLWKSTHYSTVKHPLSCCKTQVTSRAFDWFSNLEKIMVIQGFIFFVFLINYFHLLQLNLTTAANLSVLLQHTTSLAGSQKCYFNSGNIRYHLPVSSICQTCQKTSKNAKGCLKEKDSNIFTRC